MVAKRFATHQVGFNPNREGADVCRIFWQRFELVCDEYKRDVLGRAMCRKGYLKCDEKLQRESDHLHSSLKQH